MISFRRYEQFAWFPNAIAFLVMLGVGGKDLRALSTPAPDAADVVSYSSLLCISIFTWCTVTPDYGVHHAPVAR